MFVSRDTLLRQVKQAAVRAPPADPVRVLGVDDWAWRKGQSYGTILVDLERRCVIDVLPDRSADSFANWLTTRPEVKVVSRDRQGLYADGSRRGAPQAVQVADRFHLLQNLIEAVEKQLTPMLNAMIIPGAMGPLASGVAEQPSAAGAVLPVLRESVPEAQRAVVRAWFEQVMTLHRQGRNNQQIMRATGVGRRRVETWTRLGHLPERNRVAPRVGMPESFRGYLSQRWTQGCRSAKDLLKEVRKQGYVGCYSGLADLLSSWRSSRTVSPSTTAVVSTPCPADIRGRQLASAGAQSGRRAAGQAPRRTHRTAGINGGDVESEQLPDHPDSSLPASIPSHSPWLHKGEAEPMAE